MKRLAIYQPWECDCRWGKVPTVYKSIGVVNAYFVECDRCGMKSGKFQCVEDAIDAWDIGHRTEKQGETNER